MNKILLAIVAASVFAASCNTSLTVQKKQHSNGYYVSVSKTEKKAQKVENTIASKNETIVLSAREQAAMDASVQVAEAKAITANQEVQAQVENKNAVAKTVRINKEAKSLVGKKVAQVKAAEQTMKLLKAPAVKENRPMEDDAIILIILAIFLCPIAVGLATDWNAKDVLINVLLWVFCLGIGGIIHAFYVLNREGVI
ncbi:MAG: YqaE/Pmp3 family membrane protein [Flavobacteriales bacterium]